MVGCFYHCRFTHCDESEVRLTKVDTHISDESASGTGEGLAHEFLGWLVV